MTRERHIRVAHGVVVNGTRHDAGESSGYLRANLTYPLKRPELREGGPALCREMIATTST